MKTYRICWSRIDHVLEREDYFHVIVPARNKVGALAAVRKYFATERAKEKIRYGHYIVSMDVAIGKGNRKNVYWRPLNFANIYVAGYRISLTVADISGLVVPGIPRDETVSEMRIAFDVQEWMKDHPRGDGRFNDILNSYD